MPKNKPMMAEKLVDSTIASVPTMGMKLLTATTLNALVRIARRSATMNRITMATALLTAPIRIARHVLRFAMMVWITIGMGWWIAMTLIALVTLPAVIPLTSPRGFPL